MSDNESKIIFISNENPIHWRFCPKCSKKLKKDIQKECYWVGCNHCHITYKLDDSINQLHEQIKLYKEYIDQLENTRD